MQKNSNSANLIIYNYTNMHFCNSALSWYWPLWGRCCPLYPLPRNRVAIVYRVASFLPSSRRYSRSAPYTARSPTVPNGNQVAHSGLCQPLCARVTSLDSAQALPKYCEGSDFSPSSPTAGVTLPRPPLRTFCPKNPTMENRSPWTLSSEACRQDIF